MSPRDLARRRPSTCSRPSDRSGPDGRAAALAYTRETDSLTTGVLYQVREPSLVERIQEVRSKAVAAGAVTGTADILRAFAPGF